MPLTKLNVLDLLCKIITVVQLSKIQSAHHLACVIISLASSECFFNNSVCTSPERLLN